VASPQWRIYYADGSTFDSDQGEPWDAPATRVLLILQQHHDLQERAYYQWEDDYYLWKYDRWFAHGSLVLQQYWFMEKYPHPRACLAGETVNNEIWQRVTAAAKADKDFNT
jgi:hypothetical protein